MPRFASVFAIVLLLLPSSLGALVRVVEDCSSMAMPSPEAASCCCEHDAPDAGLGPFLSKGCCCEFDAPLEPLHRQEQPRAIESGEPLPQFGRTAVAVQIPDYHDPNCVLFVVEYGPPRAPPGSILVRFQRFLI